MNPAGVVHLSMVSALGNFFTQVRQPNVRAETRNQILFSVLPRASAFLALQVHHFAGVFKEGERAVHSDQRVMRSIAGHRALAKIHNATTFRNGTKNAIVHHLLSPTRPKIFAIGMALSTRIRMRMVHCQKLNDPISTLPRSNRVSASHL
jgi:hypothetical protein